MYRFEFPYIFNFMIHFIFPYIKGDLCISQPPTLQSIIIDDNDKNDRLDYFEY